MDAIPFEIYPPDGGMVKLALRHRRLVNALERSIAPTDADFARMKRSSNLLMGWHRRVENPYLAELESLHEMGFLIYPMNGALEFGCTTAMVTRHNRPVLWRTLDWPWPHMAGGLLVVQMPSTHGVWYNVTWPNFVGVANALAPGRFALAVNRAPSWYEVKPATHRRLVLNSKNRSPLHLAREVMQHAPDYATAKQWLLSSKLCTTAIFTLVGMDTGERCVIEHWSDRTIEVPDAVAATNHWQAFPPNRVRPSEQSKVRLREMKARLGVGYIRPLGWLTEPVLFEHTVLAMEACPASGVLRVRGVDNRAIISHFDDKFEAA